MFEQKKIAMVMAEFLGTAVLTVAVYSIAARTAFPLFTGLAAGGTLALMILAVGSASGAHINPAVTLSMWTLNKIKTTQAVVYVTAQMLGGLAAWWLLTYFLGHSLNSLAGKFDWKVLVAEAIGTAVFTFGVAAATLQNLEQGKLAAAAGISLALGIMVASLASNGVVNPAVALGIQSWNWAYVAGPIIGGVIGMNLYALVFAPGSIGIKTSAGSRKK